MAPTTAAAAPHHPAEAGDELERLAVAARATDDPRHRAELHERIVLLALPLADSIALRYQGRGIETDDLLQVARTALVKAVHRYRPGAGAGFGAYAAPTVHGEVKRWFRDQGWSVRPPRRVQELRADLVAEEERLRHTLLRDPSDREVARALAVSASDVAEARSCSAGYHAVSLDAPSPTGGSLADRLLVEPGPAGAYELHDALHRSVAHLDGRQRLVLHLRFVEELTQAEIGQRIGVSQMQVSRILRGIVDRLRHDLLADEGTPEGSAA